MIKLVKPPLIGFYNKYSITIYISREYHHGLNGIGKEYESYNCKTLTLGFEPKWFANNNWFIHGIISKGYTICGITFYYLDFCIDELL